MGIHYITLKQTGTRCQLLLFSIMKITPQELLFREVVDARPAILTVHQWKEMPTITLLDLDDTAPIISLIWRYPN